MTRLFGTNGIRWTVGGESDPCFSTRLGLAMGSHFGAGSKVCVGRDTRTTGPHIFTALTSGLMACGVDVIDLGVVPTPVVQYSVQKLAASGGLVITASHNPPEYNGVKCLADDGTEISRDDEASIEGIYAAESFARADWKGIGSVSAERSVQETYRKEMVSRFMLPAGVRMNVIVDCSNGTAGAYSPDILRKIGCGVSTLNAQPDGAFPGRYPEPVKENLTSLMMAVECGDADFGAAHDGDADRAIFVDGKGRYVTGDHSFALFARATVRKKGGKVVTPVNSSMVVEHVVRENGGEVVYSPIGSPLIARQMKEINATIGGEGNGGVIFPDVQHFRDGILTAVRMAHLLAEAGRPLSELVGELPEYHLARTKLPLADRKLGEAVLEKVKESAEGKVTDIDGIKDVRDDHWVLVRLSGTEPVLRITAECDSKAKTKKLLDENRKRVEEIIASLSS
jgi:phosphomannomutase/phosphoglucomutase